MNEKPLMYTILSNAHGNANQEFKYNSSQDNQSSMFLIESKLY